MRGDNLEGLIKVDGLAPPAPYQSSLAQPPVFVPVEPPCHTCRHWVEGSMTCAAFPEGIPLQIWARNNLHTEPFPGDHNIQWEPR